ncbi:MAG: DUF1326 domain-containing protein [Solirubrobacterales bacterium]
MAWQLSGQMIESCSCNMFCPCWFGVQELMIMDQGWCASVLAFKIEEGSADGVDLGGRTVVFTPHFPGPTLFDGNGTARLYVDEGASDEQRREVEAIFQGRKGGPMEPLGPLFTTWLPTQSAAIGVREDGEAITVSVGGAGEMRSQLLRDPEGQAFTLRGGGFVAGFGLEQAELAPTSSQWSDSDLPEQFETKSGARGSFAWSG